MAQITDIAKIKMPDLNCMELESAIAQVVGTSKSMGLEIK
jgi:large subunit ribosomal protein L11